MRLFYWILSLFRRSKPCYYVSKNDVLPSPLSREEERSYLEALQAGSMEARDRLIEHNLRLVVYVAKKYDHSANASLEDLVSIGSIGLVKRSIRLNWIKTSNWPHMLHAVLKTRSSCSCARTIN